MVKRVYVFDEDIAVRAMLWKIFTPRGYKVDAYPKFSVCPETFYTPLIDDSDHANEDFMITSITDPDLSKPDSIKAKIEDKGCKVRHIALMAETWSEGDLKTAQALNYKTFRKPLSQSDLYSWIKRCEERSGAAQKVVRPQSAGMNY